MPFLPPQREFALEIVKRLRAAGFEAFWAGGCVRDQLLGLQPKDYDVATSATPEQIRGLFGKRRTLAIGASFGVVTVLAPTGQIDVATFRSDATYSDGRHPDSVEFTTAELDAQRRDFTINGLFYDPLDDRVVDYVEGQQDLERRTIRAIGEPRQRFSEDKLRMLRAVRFAAAYEFSIEPATLAAIIDMSADVTVVSAERIGAEVRRMLVDSHRAVALELLRSTHLLKLVLPELAETNDDAFAAIKDRLARLVEPTLPLAFAALLVRGSGTETAVQTQAQAIGRRLRFTNKEIERTRWLLAQEPVVANASHVAWPKIQRLLVHEGAGELIALREAIAAGSDPGAAFCRERLAWPPERLDPPPLLAGSDLIEHGLSPGPQFAPLLEQIRDAQLEGKISTRDEALALLDRLR